MKRLFCLTLCLLAVFLTSCELLGMSAPPQPTESELQLINAVLAGNTKQVKALLGSGVSPDTMAASGDTVLMTATYGDKLEVMDLLIGAGANVNKKDFYNGNTALFYAQSPSAITRLTKAGVVATTLNKQGQTPLHKLIPAGIGPKTTSTFVNAGVDVNVVDKSKMTAASYAISMDNVTALNTLVSLGANIRSVDLESARNVSMFNALLKAGAKIEDVPTLLLTYTQNASYTLESNQRTAFFSLIDTLLSKKVDVNFVDSNGESAIFYAVQGLQTDSGSVIYDPVDLVNVILKYKPDVSIVNKRKENVLNVLGKTAYAQGQENPLYSFLFEVAGNVTSSAADTLGSSLGGGRLGGLVSSTVNDAANKQFYKIAAEKITPKSYKALEKAGAKF